MECVFGPGIWYLVLGIGISSCIGIVYWSFGIWHWFGHCYKYRFWSSIFCLCLCFWLGYAVFGMWYLVFGIRIGIGIGIWLLVIGSGVGIGLGILYWYLVMCFGICFFCFLV